MTNASSAETRLTPGLLAAALLALLALRLAGLIWSGLGLYVDEAQYWLWSRQLAFGYFSKPGMIAWLIAGTTSVCGEGAACVRLSAPILHIGTAVLVYLLGRRLYGHAVGAFAGLGYALMPAVAFSSLIISTDVPLLLFWTAGLIGAYALAERPAAGSALLFGLAIAFGLNAKYAMIYLPVLTLVWLAVTPDRRGTLKSPWLWLALAIGALGFVPNLIWNAQHGFVTFAHTGGNVGVGHMRLSPGKPFDFLASQFAIAGPVMLGAALLMPFRRRGAVMPAADRFLLITSLPIILGVAANALFGSMNANWAATAFPGLTVAATAYLVRGGHKRWLTASLAIGLVASLIIPAGVIAFRFIDPPARLGQARRMVNWDQWGEAVAAAAQQTGIPTLVAGGRALSAQSVYELRNSGLDVRALKARDARPADHFQMTAPWSPGDALPVLLVTENDPATLDLGGARVSKVADIPVRLRLSGDTTVPLYRLDPP
jgi:4-amino-4-deoxy-L-arabinose transferase-like glycosyltransferase